MNILRFTVLLGLLLVVQASGPRDLGAQIGCWNCEDCGGGHENLSCPWCLLANDDGYHPCWAYSCSLMQAQGIHSLDLPCNVDAGEDALAALRASFPVRARDVPALLIAHGRRIRTLALSDSEEVLQVLECEARRVIAQFPIIVEDP